MREINFTDNSHPVIKGILDYLASGKDFDGCFWNNIIESNDNFPHAPWWDTKSVSTSHDSYNPAACLAGFIIKYADKQSELYSLGCRIAREAVNKYISQGFLDDMHTVSCYIRLMQYVEEAGVTDVFDIDVLKNKLKKQVTYSITRNTDEWETSYVCKPSQFFNSRESIFYIDNKEIADFECEFIIRTQLDDGSWNITWKWADYPEEWAISKTWWKSNNIITYMLYLKGFDKICVSEL